MNLGRDWKYYVVDSYGNVYEFENLFGKAHLGYSNSKMVDPNLVLVGWYHGPNKPDPITNYPRIWVDNDECWRGAEEDDTKVLTYITRVLK